MMLLLDPQVGTSNPIIKISGWPKLYGYAGHDQVGYNVIQTYDGTYGTHTSSDGYLNAGVTHPNACGVGSHEYYELKTSKGGSGIWTPGCQLNNGKSYGGSMDDFSFCGVQTCDGYIFGGYAQSGNPSTIDGDVSCNNTSGTKEMWLLDVNATSGTKNWDQSIGGSGDDEIHSIKRSPDGCYYMGGDYDNVTTNSLDFYVARFELTDCTAPTNLSASLSSCTETFSWTSQSCIPKYYLQYKKALASAWTTVTNPSNPYSVALSNGKYVWQVIAVCSSHVTATTSGTPFTIVGCKLADNDPASRDFSFTLFPAPADHSTTLSFQVADSSIASIRMLIYDAVGKTVSDKIIGVKNGNVSEQISTAEFPQGFYAVQLIVGAQPFLAKLIVQHQ